MSLSNLSHKDKKKNRTTLVSILTEEWSSKIEEYIDFWVSCEIPFYLYVCKESYDHLGEYLQKIQNANIKMDLEPYHYKNTWAYQQVNTENVSLPPFRNNIKDTEEYLWNGHAKVEYVVKTIETNPFGTEFYAWVDLNMPVIFRKDPSFVRDYLREYYSKITYPLDSPLFIPGCISTKRSSNDKDIEVEQNKIFNHVNWRFCGSFFLGSISAMHEFMELYHFFFMEFFLEKKILTWEVNFWAWLEVDNKGLFEWRINWYFSDHCENMLQLPDHSFFILKKENGYYSYAYDYYPISNYRPTSACYLYYQERHWLNTRFVSYYLTSYGHYTYPGQTDSIIRNKNICSELSLLQNSLHPITFLEMEINSDRLGIPFQSGFSEGIEDIRIYEYQDEIRFIGTTLSFSNEKDKLRIIRGKYDLSLGILSDACVIDPPTDTYCEKNWIPWIDVMDDNEYFIYKWCPLEIGKVIDVNNRKKLMITKSIPTNPFIFSKIRGSTPFIDYIQNNGLLDNKSYRIGVVHYSEETVPRQYYHRFIVLDKCTMEVKQYSDPFCFEKVGVEFCIGFTILESKFVFWISQMDRDAMMVEIDMNVFQNKWRTI